MTLCGRVNTEEKERRRKWAQKLTPKPSKAAKKSVSIAESEEEPNDDAGFLPESIVQRNKAVGFLPKNIVEMLAAREK